MSDRDRKLSVQRSLESSVLGDVVERTPRPVSEDELVALSSQTGSSRRLTAEIHRAIENLVEVALLERHGEMLNSTPAGQRAAELEVGITTRSGERLRQNLRANVAALRGRKGWSQAELAKRASVTTGTISDLEKGRTESPRVETLHSLSLALEAPIDRLYDEPENL